MDATTLIAVGLIVAALLWPNRAKVFGGIKSLLGKLKPGGGNVSTGNSREDLLHALDLIGNRLHEIGAPESHHKGFRELARDCLFGCEHEESAK